MSGTMALTSKQIKAAVDKLKQIRPAYTNILDFYGCLFIAQEDSKADIRIDPVMIAGTDLAMKKENQFSLVNISEFVIDEAASKILFEKICKMAREVTGKLGETAESILNLIDTEAIDFPRLFASLLREDGVYIKKLINVSKIDKEILVLLTYSSIHPSIVSNTEQLSIYIDENALWEKGYCPICGQLPGFALLDDQNKRFFQCGFCRYRWPTSRRFCPFCENREEKTLAYFFSEAEKEYRVDLCETCNKYIKTIDLRNTERIIYIPLEQVATLHLDMKAKAKGYNSGVRLGF